MYYFILSEELSCVNARGHKIGVFNSNLMQALVLLIVFSLINYHGLN